MAITQRGISSVNTGATPVNNVAIAPPAGYVNGDMGRVYMVVSGSGVAVTAPPGWALVPGYPVSLSAPEGRVFVFGRTFRTVDPAAGWTWIFDTPRNCIAVMVAYYDDAGGFVRACNGAPVLYQGLTDFYTTDALVSSVANQAALTVFVAGQADTFTMDSTEIFDGQTSAGSGDVTMAVGEVLPLAGTGPIAQFVGTVDSAVPTSGCAIIELLTIGGMTQPLGTPSLITIHKNSLMYNATSWDMAELSYSFPNQFLRVGSTASRQVYARTAFTSGWTIGSASSPETTTWVEKNAIIFGAPPTYVNSNHSNWRTEWGTKIGSGDDAAGFEGVRFVADAAITIRGHMKLYDYEFDSTGTIQLLPGAAALDGDLIDGAFTHQVSAAGALTIGSSAFPIANLYGYEIRYKQGTTNDAVASIFATVNKKVKAACVSTRAWFAANAANAFRMQDVEFHGVPSGAFVRWGGSLATGWRFFKVKWRDGSTKFQVVTSNQPGLSGASIEGSFLRLVLIDELGAALSGKRVKLTDSLSNVLVDALTDVDGRIAFAFEEFVNGVPLIDHYAVGTSPTRRHRSPVKLEINPVGDPSYDAALASHTVLDLWPEWVDVDGDSGSFTEKDMTVQLGPPPAPAASQEPVLVEDVPIEAPGEVRVQMAVPEAV